MARQARCQPVSSRSVLLRITHKGAFDDILPNSSSLDAP